MKNFFSEAGFWLGLGPALLILAGLKDNPHLAAHLPAAVWFWLFVVGVILTVLGFIVVTAGSLADLSDPIIQMVGSVSVRREKSRLLSRPAVHSDLAALYKFFKKKFKNTPSVALMASWLDRNDSCFWLFFSVAKGRNLGARLKLVGAYKLLPITDEAVRDLEHRLTTGSEFRPEHICRPSDKVAAYYAGDLLVPRERYRGVVQYALETQCIEIVRQNLPIYARPFTRSGKTIMEVNGFITYPDESTELKIGQLSKLDPRFATSTPFEFRRHRGTRSNRETAV